jgi:hypothetical protein
MPHSRDHVGAQLSPVWWVDSTLPLASGRYSPASVVSKRSLYAHEPASPSQRKSSGRWLLRVVLPTTMHTSYTPPAASSSGTPPRTRLACALPIVTVETTRAIGTSKATNSESRRRRKVVEDCRACGGVQHWTERKPIIPPYCSAALLATLTSRILSGVNLVQMVAVR